MNKWLLPAITRPRGHAANWRDETVLSVWACAVRVSFVIIHLNTEFRLIVAVYRNTVQ